jgi:phosphatidylglycerophosphate synthase
MLARYTYLVEPGRKFVPNRADHTDHLDRRPIGARSTGWAQALTATLIRAGFTPNAVSLLSVGFAAVGAILLGCVHMGSNWLQSGCLLGAAITIQARLLCNMLDGMIAVEGKMQSKLGALFNELPDRIADCLFLVPAGFACATADLAGGAASAGTLISADLGINLGWAAAVLAVLTAYIRAFGASQGLRQDFCGPMAKPHRMFTLTVACVLEAVERAFGREHNLILFALLLIVVGSAITCVRRTRNIVIALKSRSS